MAIEQSLLERCESKCELCGSEDSLSVHEVLPAKDDNGIVVCGICREQIENPDKVNADHWRCLNNRLWTQVPAVQVMSWRMLQRSSGEAWAQDLLDILYLDAENQAWAKAGLNSVGDDQSPWV